jgi:CubicO group peptidase (beta-lactamase class C family)
VSFLAVARAARSRAHTRPFGVALTGGVWSTATDLVRFGQAFLQQGELDGYRVLTELVVAV